MPELTLPDATVHYEVSGSGPWLVLVAGFMSDSASWEPLLPLLESNFSVLRLDNRTCGRTKPWDAPVSMDQWVDDILSLMAHLDIPKAPVLGHSLGGIIGWALAARAPERLTALAMMGSAPIITPRNTDLWRALIAVRRSSAPEETWLRLLFPWLFSERFFHDADAVNGAVQASCAYPYAQSVDAMELQLNTLHTTDAAPFMAPPPVPTLSVLSKSDMLVPYADAMVSMAGIEVVTRDHEGHSMHWDNPEAMADIVNAFFAKHTS